jgi:hypothetical protein
VLEVIIVKDTTMRGHSVQMMMSGPTISTKLPLPAFQRLLRLANHHFIFDFQCSDGQCFTRQVRMEYRMKPNGKSRFISLDFTPIGTSLTFSSGSDEGCRGPLAEVLENSLKGNS